MSIGLIVAIISIAVLLVSGILSFIYAQNMRFQLFYVVIASFNIGVIVVIALAWSSFYMLIWPAIFMLSIITKTMDLAKRLRV